MEALDLSKRNFYSYLISISRYYYEESNSSNSLQNICEKLYESISVGLRVLSYYFSLQDKTRSEAVRDLANILGDWVEDYWNLGLSLHYDCYLGGNVDEEYLPLYSKQVKDFISRVEEVIFD